MPTVNPKQYNPSKPLAVDVLCVGHASYDLVFRVDHHPEEDEKTTASQLVTCGGGPAANAAVTCARLDCRAAFVGYLGRGTFGESHLRELEREGVLTDLIVRGSAPTPVSAILVKPDGSRTVINHRQQTIPLPDDRPNLNTISSKVLLFDGHEPFISSRLAQQAKKQQVPTILDAGSVHDGTLRLMPMVDYLVCAEQFALDYTGATAAEQALPLLAQSAPVVIITLGANGLLWTDQKDAGELAAFPIRAVDTTGAGDVFHGAFAAALSRNLPWPETLRFASAAAALCCKKTGARPAVPTLTEVDDFLLRYPG